LLSLELYVLLLLEYDRKEVKERVRRIMR
jgi:hypothetical protein